VYTFYSGQINYAFNIGAFDQNIVKPMKAVRRDILRLIQTYIVKETQYQKFAEGFLPTLKTLTDDYQSSHPEARDPEVLQLFSTMTKHMGDTISEFLPQMLDNLCQSTLSVIQADSLTFPEFREGFFQLNMNIIKHCPEGLFNQTAPRF
jgi:hypothetical protein